MEGNQQESEETSYFGKKCEREFDKVLQAVNYRTVKICYSKHRCGNPGNMKKKYKADKPSVSDESSQIVKAPSFSLLMCLTEGYKDTFNLNEFYEELKRQNKLEMRCQSLLRLALFCSGELSDEELCSVFDVLDLLSDSHESDALALCHTLLLFTLTEKILTLDQTMIVEKSILKIANSVSPVKNARTNVNLPRLDYLVGEQYTAANKLCQNLFSEAGPDMETVDILTICCSSLRNLSKNEMAVEYKYTNKTLKFIVGMTGKATQEIMSENFANSGNCGKVSATSHIVNQCLQILEHVLSLDPDMPCSSLDHEDFSLLHCLTKLLGWCISFRFQGSQSENHLVNNSSFSSFHLSTLVSILKILSILSFNPDQYDSFTNVRGLMENIMICILKSYFQSKENNIDVLLLTLELMINFYIKNKKTFVLLCLKKFHISNGEEIRSIDGLLKILANSLEQIDEIKAKALAKAEEEEKNTQNNDAKNSNSEAADMEMVLEAANEDMKLSTIVSFVSILVVFFMDTKKTFLEFIRKELTLERSTGAITVSKKVLHFASLTGGMPITGIFLLRHAIKKLSKLYEPA